MKESAPTHGGNAQQTTRRGPVFRLAMWLYATTLLSFVVAVATLVVVALPNAPDPRFLDELAQFVVETCDQSPDPIACVLEKQHVVPGDLLLLTPEGQRYGNESSFNVRCAEAEGRMGHLSLCLRAPLSPASVVSALTFGALTSLLSALFLTRRFVQPMARLTLAARAVSSGDLRTQSQLEDDGAFGEVGRAFDTMVDDLRALLDAEKELLASLSHELRTPLTRLSLALDMADEGEPLDAASLAGLRGDVHDLDELLKELLDAARLQLTEGRAANPIGQIAKSRVDLIPWMESAIAASRMRFADTDYRLVVVGEGEPPSVHGSEHLLRRALRNLIENSARVSDQTPVVVELNWSTDLAIIRVIDRGPGISPKDSLRIFSPFARGESKAHVRAGASAELGLGLTMVKRIAQGHGGSIRLEGHEGGGTIATLKVPLAAA